jgi:hypothetical protein
LAAGDFGCGVPQGSFTLPETGKKKSLSRNNLTLEAQSAVEKGREARFMSELLLVILCGFCWGSTQKYVQN